MKSRKRIIIKVTGELIEQTTRGLSASAVQLFALAEPYNLVLRIFNIFERDAPMKAAQDPGFGSTIMQ